MWRILLCLSLFASYTASAQVDTLTIGDYFNLKVGDTLAYRINFDDPQNFPAQFYMAGKVEYTILSRTDSGDSILYNIKFLPAGDTSAFVVNNVDSPFCVFRGVKNPKLYGGSSIYNGGCDVSTFSDGLGEPDCHLNSSGTWYYNRQLCLYSFGFFESGYYAEVVEGVGYKKTGMSAVEFWPGPGSFGHGGGCWVELVKYSSDTIHWLDSAGYYYVISGIESPLAEPQFSVYPQPASQYINVNLNDYASPGTMHVWVYDMVGRLIKEQTESGSKSTITVDLSFLTNGSYLLNLTESDGRSLGCRRITLMH